MKIRFLGQNCFLFTYQGKNILTDPFYNFQKDKTGFDITLQTIDYVLLTHAHGDHIADVNEVMQHYPEATLIAQPEICGYFKTQNFIDLNFGGSAKIDDLKITMVTASHTSSFPDGTYGRSPAGYIFRFPNLNVYLAGDTGVISDMSLFPKLYGEIQLAILPIGAHYTMCAKQAAFAASELLKVKKVVGCHFDTFPPIAIDHQWAKDQFDKRDVELVLPELGQEITV